MNLIQFTIVVFIFPYLSYSSSNFDHLVKSVEIDIWTNSKSETNNFQFEDRYNAEFDEWNQKTNFNSTIDASSYDSFDNVSIWQPLLRKYRTITSAESCNAKFTFEKLNPNKGVAIIIPGEDVDSKIENELYKIAEKLSISFNVLRAEWSYYQSSYIEAVANTRQIASLIETHVIDQMSSNGNKKYIYLIGLGLGCHIAAYIGKQLPGRIHRITALNPSRKFFEYEKGPETIRLTKDDAKFVDVYHTDYRGKMRMGMIFQAGTVDFYARLVNGLYPGCYPPKKTNANSATAWRFPWQKLRTLLSVCSYVAAVRIFRKTLNGCLILSLRNTRQECDNNTCIPTGALSEYFVLRNKAKRSGVYFIKNEECQNSFPQAASVLIEDYQEMGNDENFRFASWYLDMGHH